MREQAQRKRIGEEALQKTKRPARDPARATGTMAI